MKSISFHFSLLALTSGFDKSQGLDKFHNCSPAIGDRDGFTVMIKKTKKYCVNLVKKTIKNFFFVNPMKNPSTKSEPQFDKGFRIGHLRDM